MSKAISFLKIFILVLTANVILLANNNDIIINNKEDLKTSIVEMTKDFDTSTLNGKKVKAKVKFVLQADGEIILLDTGSKNKEIHNHIKKAVNRTYVKMGTIKPGNYTVELKF